MYMNLGHLASNTLLGSDSYQLLQAIPYELTCNQSLCSAYGGMCQTVGRGKFLASPAGWYYWPCPPGRCVTQ